MHVKRWCALGSFFFFGEISLILGDGTVTYESLTYPQMAWSEDIEVLKSKVFLFFVFLEVNSEI